MMGANAFSYGGDIYIEDANGFRIYFNYINLGTELELACGDYKGHFVVPEEVKYGPGTKKVTGIGKHAFYNSQVSAVTIPKSINYIGEDAFYGCTNLTTVNILDLAKWCGIDFKTKLSSPFHYALHFSVNGEEVKDLVIPDGIHSISPMAFYGCKCITSVVFPNSMRIIGTSAFEGCSGLTSINLNSVTEIGKKAFEGCFGLNSLIVPQNVVYILNQAFSSCTNLKSITIDKGEQSLAIYNKAFQDCNNLVSISFGNRVREIRSGAFSGCTSLTTLTIPNSVAAIGDQAFSGCTSLTTLTIPNNVVSINDQAFYGCTKLTTVNIGNGVKTIDNKAFYGCSNLTSLYLGNSITNIGIWAFYGAEIKTIVSLMENPCEIYGELSNTSVFSSKTYHNATLYVPIGTIDKYMDTEGWEDFLFIKEGTGPDNTSISSINNRTEAGIIRYNLNGINIAAPLKGINIIKKSDGTTEKILVK